MANRWFDYRFRVQPHHTDYSGVVWHGTYIQWMETARVECLRTIDFAFEDLVSAGYDLPVVDIQLRYHQSLKLGAQGLIRTQLNLQGIKLVWAYEIYDTSPTPQKLCATGTVVLVTIDMAKRKIVRHLPTSLQNTFNHLRTYFED